MTRIRWLVLVFLLGSTLPCDACIVQNKGRASLECPAPGAIALADTIHVILSLEGSPALVVDAPGTMPAGSAWTLVERRAPVREPMGPNRERWRCAYHFAALAPGDKVAFAFPEVKFRDGTDEQTVSFDPVFYAVTTQIKDADLAQLHDITAIESLPPIDAADPAWPWWAIVAGGVFLIAALPCMIAITIFAWRWWRGSKTRSPAQLALWEWHRLAAMKLPDQGKSERFITLLTTLLRRFLERQFTLPARRQTTPEFVRELAQIAALSADDKRFLISFLERCETVKFAQGNMSLEECRQWADAARQFLEGRSKGKAGQSLAVEKNTQAG
jgi:hypothetical protein